MGRERTWKVKSWVGDGVGCDGGLELSCPACGRSARLPMHVEVQRQAIACVGLNLIFDQSDYRPKDGYLPESVQCRWCRREFCTDEYLDKVERGEEETNVREDI
mgnify:CR=1 FL=1